jgi:prepilin-type processing-associated H-X9-DG protein
MSLLLAFVVVWSALATFGIAGLLVAPVLLGTAVYVRSAQDMGKAIITLLAAEVIFLLILIALCFPTIEVLGEVEPRIRCQNQLKQIAFALCNYHEAFGCFPPAYVAGPDGKPWHSWRVLILPFLEQEDLYEQYDFHEPWNGPSNSKLAREIPALYRCPSDSDSDNTPNTNYVAVVGPRAAWTGSEPRTLGEFRDGTNSTIMIGEAAGAGIHWMEPRDLSFDDARKGINLPGAVSISSHHVRRYGHFYHDEPRANVAMADGSVRALPERTTPATLKAMLTIDGGEPIDFGSVPEFRPRPYWPRIFAPIVLLVAFLVPLLRPRKRRETKPQEATPCDSA